MVGRNRENPYNGPATPMSMNIPMYVFQSLREARIDCHRRFSCAWDAWPSLFSRDIMTYFSSLLRKLASSGKSTIVQYDTPPMTIVASPSRMNCTLNWKCDGDSRSKPIQADVPNLTFGRWKQLANLQTSRTQPPLRKILLPEGPVPCAYTNTRSRIGRQGIWNMSDKSFPERLQSTLCQAKEEPCGEQASKICDETHRQHDSSPC